MTEIPSWRVVGDWFDCCSCNVPCRCSFGQEPDNGTCEGVLPYKIREGNYGDVKLDGLQVVLIASGAGDFWAGKSKGWSTALVIDARADEAQREALLMIWSGQAGGWPAEFGAVLGDVTPVGLEYLPISIEIADDLGNWSVEIPGLASASAEALTGGTAAPGSRVQVLNATGAEVGPTGRIATYAKVVKNVVNAFGFSWDHSGKSSKHFAFEWTGPGEQAAPPAYMGVPVSG